MKEQKNQTYSTKDNLVFLFKEIWQYDKRLIVHILAVGISEMLLPLATLGLTAIVIDAVAEGEATGLAVSFISLLLVILVLTIVSKTSMTTLHMQGNVFRVQILNKLALHLTEIDFDLFDGTKGQEKINKAFDTANNPNRVFQHSLIVAEAAVKNILGFLVYSYLLAEIH